MIEGIQPATALRSVVLTYFAIEIPKPSVEGPKIMISCVVIGTVTGSVFLIVLLFVAGDISTVLNSAAGPLLQILKNATRNNAGAICLLM
jgi:choline transport protein